MYRTVSPTQLLFVATLGLAVVAALLTPWTVQAQTAAASAPLPSPRNLTPLPTPSGVPRPVSAFEAVLLRGPVDLQLRRAEQAALWVDARDADPALVEARVISHQGRPTLEIRFEPPRGPALRRAPKVTVDGIRLAALTVEGSGDIRASGRSASLSVQLAGSGDVGAAELQAEVVSVSIAGSGDVSVNASEALNASIAGSGDLIHTGAARVSTQVAGSGRVSRRSVPRHGDLPAGMAPVPTAPGCRAAWETARSACG